MSTVVNSSDVLRVWPNLQTADGCTLMLQPGESAEVAELPEGFTDPYLEVDGAPAASAPVEPEAAVADPPAAASQPSPPAEKPAAPEPDPTPLPAEVEVTVVIDAEGEGWETVPHPLPDVSIAAQPSSGTATLEVAEGHPEETCVRVVNATPASTQAVELSITSTS